MLNGIQSTKSQRELNPSLTYITDKPLYHICSLTRGVLEVCKENGSPQITNS